MTSLVLPCSARWRALQISCMVTATHGLDPSSPVLLLRLTNALRSMSPGDAHAVLSAFVSRPSTACWSRRARAALALAFA